MPVNKWARTVQTAALYQQSKMTQFFIERRDGTETSNVSRQIPSSAARAITATIFFRSVSFYVLFGVCTYALHVVRTYVL